MKLTKIIYHNLGTKKADYLYDLEKKKAHNLLKLSRRLFTPIFFWIAEPLSRKWLERTKNPYLSEIKHIATNMPKKGAYTLNVLFEWGCTTTVYYNKKNKSMEMLRTLDWPLNGIGKNVVVARYDTPAGEYYDMTWPGFVGSINGFAPNRFAMAINQAPLIRHGLFYVGDWILNRFKVFGSHNISPAILMRKVFETCKTYDEAKEMLEKTPLNIPVFFSLVGTKKNEGCIIERLEETHYTNPADESVANQWIQCCRSGFTRGKNNPERRRVMTELRGRQLEELAPPVINNCTRLAFRINMTEGTLQLQGHERHGPVTEIFDIENDIFS